MKNNVDITEATHVVSHGRVHEIASKWGVDSKGGVASPSEGGFGVITTEGERISMWDADSYIKSNKTNDE